ncbi:MAG: hypothetical protein M1375_00160 [Candidatus Thermoplasmatota archaeon]|jgi:hypothetical protein|nr:hypothetical protein [Candidatus Thermoplasmatota archaeon]MCL5790374.1 hypothetical protein [Candidatus Thermoplasmatota archaeon]
MNWRSALISIIAILAVTWLLISAISVIQPVQGGSGSGSGSLGSGGGSGGGSGSGNGLGTGGGSGLGLNLPNFPINFHFPNLNLKNPFNIPIINFSFPDPFHFKFPPLNLSLVGSSKPSPPGGGGSTGSGKTTQTTPVQNNIIRLILNPLILIALVIAMTAIVLVIAMMKRQKPSSKKPRSKIGRVSANAQEAMEENLLIYPDQDDTKQHRSYGKSAVPYFSIDESNGLHLSIDRDLPPLWRYTDKLQYELEGGFSMELNSAYLGTGPAKDCIQINRGINQIKVKSGSFENHLEILGNVYEEDVIDALQANIGVSLLNDLSAKTIREILGSPALNEKIRDFVNLPKLIETFERVMYGRKNISRSEYETFLRNLKYSMKNPLIIWRSEKIGQ